MGFDLGETWARSEGQQDGERVLREARHRAEARAMVLLAAYECPEDIVTWGHQHNIPEFAKFTWQAGFMAGMRAAEAENPVDNPLQPAKNALQHP